MGLLDSDFDLIQEEWCETNRHLKGIAASLREIVKHIKDEKKKPDPNDIPEGGI